MIGRLKNITKNKEVANASWLIGGKVLQMVISLVVGIFTARYLGPANYGVINYGAAYVAFFSSVCTLGINSIIVKNFVEHPDEEGKTIGTTLVLRLASSLLSCLSIVFISFFADAGDPSTIAVVALCGLGLVFHIFDTFNYWFQSRYRAKRTAVATLIAYVTTAAYKIVLLVLQKNVLWFAFATSVDYIVYAVVILFFYKRDGGPRLSVSFGKAKQLLKSSYNFILSGLMVAIYGYTNKFMLKHMMDESAVGFFSTATTICAMWVFVLQAIIDSMYPTIMKLHGQSKEAFERKNKQLYAIVFYVSMSVSVAFMVFGEWVVEILYGEVYLPAVAPLKIVTWYTAFSYLGVARNAWIVCEHKQKYLKYMYVGAAIINVALNFFLIPFLGTSGAALASLITQVFTSIILPAFFKDMRHNSVLMLEAIALKGILWGKSKERTTE